jgi:hypothetical protein
MAVAPDPTCPPAIFEPPSELSGGRNEIWIAAGGGTHWGGCEVWGSINDESYDKLGIINTRAAIGSLLSPFAVGQDPDTTNRCAVDMAISQGKLHPGSRSDADKFVTLCLVGDEFVAYTNARLTSPFVYTLDGYIRRGVFGTAAADHSAGTSFVRLNQAIFRFEIPPHLKGSTIHVKLPAFNEFNGMLQSLDQVQSHSMTLAT